MASKSSLKDRQCMAEKLIRHPHTIINDAIRRAFGESDRNADIVAIETSFMRGAALKLEDAEGIIRSYAYSDPIFFWVVDVILEDETRVAVAASPDHDDIARVAALAQKLASGPGNLKKIPIVDRTKGGAA